MLTSTEQVPMGNENSMPLRVFFFKGQNDSKRFLQINKIWWNYEFLVFPGPKSRFAVSCSFNLKRWIQWIILWSACSFTPEKRRMIFFSAISIFSSQIGWVVYDSDRTQIDSDRILGDFDIETNRLLQVIFQTAIVWGGIAFRQYESQSIFFACCEKISLT